MSTRQFLWTRYVWYFVGQKGKKMVTLFNTVFFGSFEPKWNFFSFENGRFLMLTEVFMWLEKWISWLYFFFLFIVFNLSGLFFTNEFRSFHLKRKYSWEKTSKLKIFFILSNRLLPDKKITIKSWRNPQKVLYIWKAQYLYFSNLVFQKLCNFVMPGVFPCSGNVNKIAEISCEAV